MISTWLKSPALALFQEILPKEPSLAIEGLWNAPKALLTALAAQATQKNVLIVTATAHEERLAQDIAYFTSYPVLHLPSWETLPGEEIAPSVDIVGKRFAILHELIEEKKPKILLCPLQTCLQKLLPPKKLHKLCRLWKIGDTLPFSTLPQELTSLGYRKVAVAADKGEFAVRGGIIDIFPASAFEPYRIDFFGDTIDQIRTYDPLGQKSLAKIDSFFLSPGEEASLLTHNNASSLASILDYLGKNTLLILDDLFALEERYVSFKKMPGSTSSLFIPFEEFLKQSLQLSHLLWTKEPLESLSEVHLTGQAGRGFYSGKAPLQPLSFTMFQQEITTKRWSHPFQEVSSFLLDDPSEDLWQGIDTLVSSNWQIDFVTTNDSEQHTVKERFSVKGSQDLLVFTKGHLSSGLILREEQYALIPMAELTHRHPPIRQKWRKSTSYTSSSDFHELAPGEIVVHFHHGIGKYLGLEKKPNHLGQLAEFLVIEYAKNGKLYVPITQSYLVSRYIGSQEETPSFHTIGEKRWQRTRLQAQTAILGYAKKLLEVNAERVLKGGTAFPPDSSDMELFEQDFPFIPTEDQLQSIAEIKKDMLSSKAMDRLLCGDVGYGKTEVAMRAAFKAVIDGKKQVAVLVPTTVLALQHFETFKERMEHFPITVEMISRFRTGKEIKEALQNTATGAVDILVGTHRLLSPDVCFKDLGLVIIDEEQRFGVKAKEYLKTLKTGVDCLTLSATPIPRTLYLSLMGAREISIISTPPQDRLPIKTILAEKHPQLIQNALLRELSRDGQAFFIHNRIEALPRIREELQKLVPQARILTAHGQMGADEIDLLFHAFKNGEADILVTTTLVENGVDIPNANTILIDHAHHFGLADLYQLRGRVGRWNRPAYAYFLIPPQNTLPLPTRKRLEAIRESSGYGGGMKIAMRDLEIRGAGDILGTEQSGQIASIGFHLYCKLLKKTVEAMRKKNQISFCETRLEFTYDARFPESYVEEVSLRMELYHRLGELSSWEEAEAFLLELQDRFGPCPSPVLWLYHLTRIRIFASTHQYTTLKFSPPLLHIEKELSEKNLLKKTVPLPLFTNPEELEKYVIQLLRQS